MLSKIFVIIKTFEFLKNCAPIQLLKNYNLLDGAQPSNVEQLFTLSEMKLTAALSSASGTMEQQCKLNNALRDVWKEKNFLFLKMSSARSYVEHCFFQSFVNA